MLELTPDYAATLFSLKSLLAFMPHGMCYLWQPSLVYLHAISDLLITLAYYSIPAMLIYFVRQRKDMPFSWIFWLFGAFILSCGTNHLLEVWTLWHPHYWISGFMKLTTAIISLYTAVNLFPLIPQALALPSPATLETANQQLEKEVKEKQRLIAALTEREELFRSIFDGAAIGIGLADMSGRIVTVNPALAQMLGYKQVEMNGKPFTNFIHPDDQYLDETEELYQGMVSGNRDYYQMEKQYITKKGETRWTNLTVSLVRGGHQLPQYSLSMVQDITERKQTEKELKRHRENLQDLVAERTAEIAQANQQLSWQATHDELTQLINRRAFAECLAVAVLDAQQNLKQHALCYLDLDRFKIVNDTCGHQAGDELLCQISELFQSRCRKVDAVARLGGDEFAILLYDCSLVQAQRIAQDILSKINDYKFRWQEKYFSIGVSIGLVTITHNSPDPEAVLVTADTACYAAKRQGRNQICIYPEELIIEEDETSILTQEMLTKQ